MPLPLSACSGDAPASSARRAGIRDQIHDHDGLLRRGCPDRSDILLFPKAELEKLPVSVFKPVYPERQTAGRLLLYRSRVGL